MGKRRGAGSASRRRAHEDVRPHRRDMHVGTAEDRDHHARKGRCSINKTCDKQQQEPGDRSMIYVVATSQVKPELRDAFIKGARECIAATRKEKAASPMRATPASTI